MTQEDAEALARRFRLDPPELIGTEVRGVPGIDDLRRQVERRLRSSGGRPTNPEWETSKRIPFKPDTWQELHKLAKTLSEGPRRVAAGQLAALIIERYLSDPWEAPPAAVPWLERFAATSNHAEPGVGRAVLPPTLTGTLHHRLNRLRAARRHDPVFAGAPMELRNMIDQARDLEPCPTELLIRLNIEYSTVARHLGKTDLSIPYQAIAEAWQMADDAELTLWRYRCDYESLRQSIAQTPVTAEILDDRRQELAHLKGFFRTADTAAIDLAWCFHAEGELYRSAAASVDDDPQLLRRASRAYLIALRHFADQGDSYGAANANERLAVCAIRSGKPQRAMYHADAALETARRERFARTSMRAQLVRSHAACLLGIDVSPMRRLAAELDAAGYQRALTALHGVVAQCAST